MSAAASLTTHSSPLTLPPTPRDFEIHRWHLVEHISTWNLAKKHDISQTRVRQIVHRVTQWLIATLPVSTEADLERQTRFAQHLAADQLNHQIEQLQNLWQGTCDPKYFRQQTRAILALARLGTIPGTIDALAADAEESSRHTPCAVSEAGDELVPSVPAADAPMRGFTLAEAQTKPKPPDTGLPGGSLGASTADDLSPSPPPGDCSPACNSPTSDLRPPTSDLSPTDSPAATSSDSLQGVQLELDGLNLMERRLLTLIENVAPQDYDGRKQLEATLAKVRRRRDEVVVELRLSPTAPGAKLKVGPSVPDGPEPSVATPRAAQVA